MLEYCNCIWSPLFKRQSIIIENVQRRATRLLPMFGELSYEERLQRLKLPSLRYRRMRGDLIQLYKIVHKIDNLDHKKFFAFSHVNFTRGDKFKIYIRFCCTQVRQNSFIFRTVKTWNGLKFDTKNSRSLYCFKNAIDRELHKLKYVFDT